MLMRRLSPSTVDLEPTLRVDRRPPELPPRPQRDHHVDERLRDRDLRRRARPLVHHDRAGGLAPAGAAQVPAQHLRAQGLARLRGVPRRRSGRQVRVEISSAQVRAGGEVFGMSAVLSRGVPAMQTHPGWPHARTRCSTCSARGAWTEQKAQMLGISTEAVRDHVAATLRTLRVHFASRRSPGRGSSECSRGQRRRRSSSRRYRRARAENRTDQKDRAGRRRAMKRLVGFLLFRISISSRGGFRGSASGDEPKPDAGMAGKRPRRAPDSKSTTARSRTRSSSAPSRAAARTRTSTATTRSRTTSRTSRSTRSNPRHMIASSNDYGSCCDQFYTTFDSGRDLDDREHVDRATRSSTGSDPVTVFDRKHGVAHPLVAELLVPAPTGEACDGDVSSRSRRRWTHLGASRRRRRRPRLRHSTRRSCSTTRSGSSPTTTRRRRTTAART